MTAWCMDLQDPSKNFNNLTKLSSTVRKTKNPVKLQKDKILKIIMVSIKGNLNFKITIRIISPLKIKSIIHTATVCQS